MVAGKAERLADAMAVFSQGDVERFGEILLADDVVWHWPGRSSVSGEYRGRDAALGLLRGLHELARSRLTVEPIDMLEGEDYLMSFTQVTAEREGERLSVVMADAMRFGDDGRVVGFWTLSDDQDAVDRFIGWSPYRASGEICRDPERVDPRAAKSTGSSSGTGAASAVAHCLDTASGRLDPTFDDPPGKGHPGSQALPIHAAMAAQASARGGRGVGLRSPFLVG